MSPALYCCLASVASHSCTEKPWIVNKIFVHDSHFTIDEQTTNPG